MKDLRDAVKYWNSKYKPENAIELLLEITKEYQEKSVFTSSMGLEDQVITDILAKSHTKCRIITLDTGRLFNETYNLIEKSERKYKIKIEIYFPNHNSVEKMVSEKGVNLFYESVENRKECCHIRKIEPLQRALQNSKVWITGLRSDQSETRVNTHFAEFDEKFQVLKINPLLDWSLDDTWKYIKENNVPYNPLHDEGYPSIGCAPCTRSIMPGENIRAGRWWWESPETKECGLHIKDGVLVSSKEK
jgi:phosphoadenosine phosphosulfate reductase